jgi:(p)ppGpp synthase/HD superfamily hydrolase
MFHHDQIALARRLATAAHQGQRYGSRDYIEHPAEVAHEAALLGGDSFCVAAAWLHDVIEDTALDAAALLAAGVAPEVIATVTMLSRQSLPDGSKEPYHAAFIVRCAGDPRARLVKRADLSVNLRNLDRPDAPTNGAALRIRYVQALAMLADDHPG